MLKPLKKKIKIYKNVGFDIETDVEKGNSFVLGSLYFSDDEYYVFDKPNDLINFILDNPKKFKDTKIWAHNLGFDFLGTFFNSEHFTKFQIIFRGSDFITAQSYIYQREFHYSLPKKTRDYKQIQKVEFFDTFNFAKYSLAKIGDIIDMPKYKKPDFLGQTPKNKAEYDELVTYNIQDSKVCKVFADFLQTSFKNLNCQMKSTIASTSMDMFLRNYLKFPLWSPDKQQLKFLYAGFYGGRTEAIYRGHSTEKINVYDYNSLYPSVMKDFEYPDPNSSHKLIRKHKKQLMVYEGVTEIKMEAPKMFIPYLPSRQDKLIFPTGIIRGIYSNFEIRKALDYGYKIKKIYGGIYYTKSFRPFTEFVDTCYNKRLEYKKQGNPMELPVKILMNSLYGKFAQNIFDKTMIEHLSNITKKDYYKETTQKIGNSDYFRILKEYTDDKIPKFVNPIISLYTTAFARDKLFKGVESCGDNIFYMDTDSLMTTKNLTNSSKLGDLKHEYSTKDIYIVKPKFYAVRTTKDKEFCKIKGLHSCPQNIQFFTDLMKKPQANFMKFIKFKEALIQGLQPNTMKNMIKNFSLEDSKRLWGSEYDYKNFERSKALSLT